MDLRSTGDRQGAVDQLDFEGPAPHDTYMTVHRMATTIREAIYQCREEWREVLTGEVEADGDRSQGDGSQDDRSASDGTRKPRARGLSERGRARWSSGRPPAVLGIERDGAGRVLELQPDVTQQTLVRSAIRHVELGSRIDTDDFSGYRLLKEVYYHRGVDHEETYVTENDVHCNTAGAEWSIFKPWWREFRGVAKRHAYRYLSEYSFRRSHREEPPQKRLRQMVAFLIRLLKEPGRQTLHETLLTTAISYARAKVISNVEPRPSDARRHAGEMSNVSTFSVPINW